MKIQFKNGKVSSLSAARGPVTLLSRGVYTVPTKSFIGFSSTEDGMIDISKDEWKLPWNEFKNVGIVENAENTKAFKTAHEIINNKGKIYLLDCYDDYAIYSEKPVKVKGRAQILKKKKAAGSFDNMRDLQAGHRFMDLKIPAGHDLVLCLDD